MGAWKNRQTGLPSLGKERLPQKDGKADLPPAPLFATIEFGASIWVVGLALVLGSETWHPKEKHFELGGRVAIDQTWC